MRLIFVRHGEPDYINDCLTENGVIQAKSTAERLKKEPITAIYASPMGRARQTASYTAEDHGLDINVLDFMHEINWGIIDEKKEQGELKYEGHPWSLANDLLAECPEYVGSFEWDKHPYFADNKCTAYYHMISEKIDGFLEQFGLERKDGAYFCRKACDDTIALFSHGGSGACVLSHVFSLPFPFVLASLPYGVCSVTVIDFPSREGEQVIPRFELFNDMGHIDNLKKEKLHFEK